MINRSTESEMRREIMMEPVVLDILLGGNFPYEALTDMEGTTYHWAQSEDELPDHIQNKI